MTKPRIQFFNYNNDPKWLCYDERHVRRGRSPREAYRAWKGSRLTWQAGWGMRILIGLAFAYLIFLNVTVHGMQ